MTKPDVGVIIRCGDSAGRLLRTLTDLDGASPRPDEVVLVQSPSTPPQLVAWLTAVANRRSLRVVVASSSRPGAVVNAGLHAVTSQIVVVADAGDSLDLSGREWEWASDPSQGDVACAVRLAPDEAADIEFAMALRPDSVPRSTALRRSAVDAVGGFDETLEAFEFADLVLRLLHAGHRIAVTDVRSPEGRDVDPPVQADDCVGRTSRAEALEVFVGRYLSILRRNPAATLRHRDVALQDLAWRYRPVVERRATAICDLESLEARRTGLLARLPESQRAWLDLGELRRTSPWSRNWGYDRGVPVDRYYIERFLQARALDIAGRVLEVQEPDYTLRFGGARVTRSDVIDLNAENSRATIFADLREAPNIADDTYDCIILTQTLHVVDDMPAVVEACHRILAPGGILLVTLPCTSRVCVEYGRDGDYWRVTEAGARALFERRFGSDNVAVASHGNVLSSAAFHYGLGWHELQPGELETDDAFNPTIVSVRARKSGSRRRSATNRASDSSKEGCGLVLLYHRVAEAWPDTHRLAIPPPLFEQQMAHLRHACVVMPLDELVHAATESRLPARAVAVTLDDGYADNLAQACPILARAGLPATIFMTTAGLDGSHPFHYWWDLLEWALIVEPLHEHITVPLPTGMQTFTLRTQADRAHAHEILHRALVSLDANARDRIVAMATGSRRPPAQVGRRMSLAELRSLGAYRSIRVGAHGVDHLALPFHPFERQTREVRGSRADLETVLGQKVTAFAYPFGAWREDTPSIVADAGFSLAVTCDIGIVGPGIRATALPRREVQPATLERFEADLEASWAGAAPSLR